MFSSRNWVQLGLIVAALLVFSPRSLGQTISCSSDDGRRHYCPADSQGRVRLVQQHSESRCEEGYSWGSDGRGVWVDHGCRADFALEGGRDSDRNRDRDRDHDGYQNENRSSDRGQVISCSSDDMHRHYCPADTRGGVSLIKQNSESSCRQGRSWGFDDRGIWVDRGCRADFQVGR
jgi:hypothetical protein